MQDHRVDETWNKTEVMMVQISRGLNMRVYMRNSFMSSIGPSTKNGSLGGRRQCHEAGGDEGVGLAAQADQDGQEHHDENGQARDFDRPILDLLMGQELAALRRPALPPESRIP